MRVSKSLQHREVGARYCFVAIQIFVLPAILVAAGATLAQAQWELAVGVQYAPTTYGGDSNGALFPSAAIATSFREGWSARLRVARGTYTDQGAVGRATFTTIDFAVRHAFGAATIHPFFEVAPAAVDAQWGPPTGTHYLLAGGRAGLGLTFRPSRRLGVDVTASYLLTEGTTDYGFADAPPRQYDGLSTAVFGTEVFLGL